MQSQQGEPGQSQPADPRKLRPLTKQGAQDSETRGHPCPPACGAGAPGQQRAPRGRQAVLRVACEGHAGHHDGGGRPTHHTSQRAWRGQALHSGHPSSPGTRTAPGSSRHSPWCWHLKGLLQTEEAVSQESSHFSISNEIRDTRGRRAPQHDKANFPSAHSESQCVHTSIHTLQATAYTEKL